jgi:hypothetical protein
LFGRFALAEDDFRESLPDGPVVIDAAKPRSSNGSSRGRAHVASASFGRQPSLADRIEQRAKGVMSLGELIDGVTGHFAVVRALALHSMSAALGEVAGEAASDPHETVAIYLILLGFRG